VCISGNVSCQTEAQLYRSEVPLASEQQILFSDDKQQSGNPASGVRSSKDFVWRSLVHRGAPDMNLAKCFVQWLRSSSLNVIQTRAHARNRFVIVTQHQTESMLYDGFFIKEVAISHLALNKLFKLRRDIEKHFMTRD